MTIILTYLSGLSFIFYGCMILMTSHMIKEFERYGMSRFRLLTGVLELLGGLGLLVGLYARPIFLVASLGLAVLMFMGTITRIGVKDRAVEIIPAFVLMLINFYLFYAQLIRV